MKKILGTFLLILSFFAVQNVSAAPVILAWDGALPSNGGTATGDANSATNILTGRFEFNTTGSAIDHDWNFTLTPAATVKTAVSLLIDFGTTATKVAIDGVALNNLGSGQWGKTLFLTAFPNVHNLKLSGLGFEDGSQYNISMRASVVPVPAAIWLFGSALAGLVGVSRRKASALAA